MNAKYSPFVKAILYADIFDFPLYPEEVYRFAIGKSTKSNFEQFIVKPPSYIANAQGLYCLKKRKDIIQKRLQRQKAGNKKLIIAKKACDLLARIPTIKFIGISGGLALLNADTKDDIDFFIITKANAMWTTRLLVAVLLELYGLRRRRGGSKVSDRICVNMYLDETQLQFPRVSRDLYVAHEIVQVRPLFSRSNTYEKFIKQNNWINTFLPNASSSETHTNYRRVENEPRLSNMLANRFVEHSVKVLQKWYMKSHRTKEVISDTILAFHPVDYRGNTLLAFTKKVYKYEKV